MDISFLSLSSLLYNFLSFSKTDHHYFRKKVEFSIGGEFFHCIGQRVIVKGFTSIMPWLAVSEKSLPQFAKGDKIEVSKVELFEVLFELACLVSYT